MLYFLVSAYILGGVQIGRRIESKTKIKIGIGIRNDIEMRNKMRIRNEIVIKIKVGIKTHQTNRSHQSTGVSYNLKWYSITINIVIILDLNLKLIL